MLQSNVNYNDIDNNFRYDYVNLLKDPEKIHEKFNKKNLDENEILFGILCGEGLIDLAKSILNFDTRIRVNSNSDFAFRIACKNNHVPVIKWLLLGRYKFNINVKIYDNYPFRKFCRNGNLFFANYFFDKFFIDPTCKNNYALRKACQYNHIGVVNWLFSLSNKINIIDMNNYAFEKCCEHGNLYLIQKLFSIDSRVFFNDKRNDYFVLACQYGHLDLAKYLLILDPYLNINCYLDYPFRIACINNHIGVALWLQTFNIKYKVTIKDSNIIDFKFK